MSKRHLGAFAVLALFLAMALSACGGSVSVGGSSISKDELATQASAALEASQGETPPPIECPEDLDAEVDATTTCVMHGSDGDYNVTMTVTSVDGDNAKFDVQVATEPN